MKQMNIISTVLIAGAVFGISAASAAVDRTAVGRVVTVDGTTLIQRSVRTDIASAGSIVGIGDAVVTTDTGTTQLVMADDTLFAMAPSSGLRINNYVMPSPANSTGAASYTLLNGAVHIITGKIGSAAAANAPRSVYTAASSHFNAANLIKVVAAPTGANTLKAAMGVITSKGADYAASQTAKSLEVLVHSGSATVCTIAGCSSLGAGEAAVVNCDGCKPTVVPSSTLDLNALNSNADFNLTNPAALIAGAQVNDPQSQTTQGTQQTTPPSQGCSTVAEQLQNATSCSSSGTTGPGIPVSPN